MVEEPNGHSSASVLLEAARPYLASGYKIERRRNGVLSLVKRNGFGLIPYWIFGNSYLLYHATERDKWIFLAVTRSGKVLTRKA